MDLRSSSPSGPAFVALPSSASSHPRKVTPCLTRTPGTRLPGGTGEPPPTGIRRAGRRTRRPLAVFGNAATGANAVTLSSAMTIGELRFDDVTTKSMTAAYTIGSSSQTITFSNGGAPLINVRVRHPHQPDGGDEPQHRGGNRSRSPTTAPPGMTTLTSAAAFGIALGTAVIVGGWSNTIISGVIGNSRPPDQKRLRGSDPHRGERLHRGNGDQRRDGQDHKRQPTRRGAGGVTLNGGALHVDADSSLDRNITLGRRRNHPDDGGDGRAPTDLPQSHLRGRFVDRGRRAPPTLTANNTYTGATIINNAGLIFGSPGFRPSGGSPQRHRSPSTGTSVGRSAS